MNGIPTPALPSALDARTDGRGYPASPSRGPSYEIIEGPFSNLLIFNDLCGGGSSPAMRQGCLTSYEAGLDKFCSNMSRF